MRLFAIFRGVLRDALDADGKKIVNLGMPTQNGDAANKAYVDSAMGAVLDDTVTQSSTNGVKSSGIWNWVKSLLPSWLTSNREEPPTQAQVAEKLSYTDEGGMKVIAGPIKAQDVFDSYGNYLSQMQFKLDDNDPVLTATTPSVDADETALAGAKATGAALAGKLSPNDVKSFARVSEHGYLVDGDGNDVDAGKIPMPTGGGAVDQAIDLKADKDTITPADFVAKTSGSYEQGEIVRYDGANYKRNSTAGADTSWVASHWTEAADADLAARLKMLKSDGTATDEFATDLLGKQVANAKVRYALATASSATMADRTVNLLTMTANETLVFPTATTHDGKTYARDFLLKLAYTAGTMTLPTGVTKVGDELSFTAGKTYLLAFTEIAANQFYIRSIEIA